MPDDDFDEITVPQALLAIALSVMAAALYILARSGVFVLVLLLALVPTVARADDVTAPATPRGKLYTGIEWSLIAAHATDLATTQRVLGTGHGYEANPFLAQFDNPIAFTAVKFGVTFAQLIGTRKIARNGHPRLAMVLNAAVAGVMAGVTVSNARVYRDITRSQ